MILQVVVNLAFHPSQRLADICVVVGVFASGSLDQYGRQQGGGDDG
jgi:hypothetical protein